jgi:acetate kinase
VGHRVVHGGEKFKKSARVTPELIKTVEEVAELAPLHNPPNLAGIRAAQGLLPNVPHVAVFDTAFHQTMEPAAFVYPLPYDWYEKYGIRRYGFHGTSHLYVSARAAALLGRPLEELKIITLHVGNGASAAAVSEGKSVDTSMGFTPLEGLVMGTRCGSIDPAVPLYIMEREGQNTDEMDLLLNKKSGLLGITGRFYDRRDILKNAEAGDERCRLALEVEARSLKKTIGAYAACMGGLDAVVFTAGVGENAPSIRAGALAGLEFLGIHLDPNRNQSAVGGRGEELITTDDSPVKVLVIPTNEALVIAEDTLAILAGS